MTRYCFSKEEAARYVSAQLKPLKYGLQLITTMTPVTSGGCYVSFAIEELSVDTEEALELSYLDQLMNTSPKITPDG